MAAAAVAAGSSFLAPLTQFRSVVAQHALANQTLIARWMKAVIIIERKEIAPIMNPRSWPASCMLPHQCITWKH